MKDLGINYLALNYLFQLSNGRKDIINYGIHVQMVEIYNEQVRDLLAEDSSSTKYPFILGFLTSQINIANYINKEFLIWCCLLIIHLNLICFLN